MLIIFQHNCLHIYVNTCYIYMCMCVYTFIYIHNNMHATHIYNVNTNIFCNRLITINRYHSTNIHNLNKSNISYCLK